MRRWFRRALAVPLDVVVAALLGVTVHSGVLAILAPFARRGRPDPPHDLRTPATRFAVIVPAHDEAAMIAATLDSLAALDYPSALYAVHVVADHCVDDTAEVARAHGAEVHERNDGVRGKGSSIMSVVRTLGDSVDPPDVIVIIDADTVVDRAFLIALDSSFAHGARVVQGHYAVRDPERSPAVALRSAAFAVRHLQRPLGRTVLGVSPGLFGNGMAFRREVLEQHPMGDGLVEDIELHMELVRAGEQVTFQRQARIEADMPPTLAASRSQHDRWERGRWIAARNRAPELLATGIRSRRRRLQLLDVVADLLVPPTSVVVLGGCLATCAAAAWLPFAGGRWPRLRVAAAVAVIVGQLATTLAALRLAQAPRAVYRALSAAPAMVVWKTVTWSSAVGRRTSETWVRTERSVGFDPDRRRVVVVEGVPLDRVTMDEAIDAIEGFVRASRATGRWHQVATVNVDYLVNLDRAPAMRKMLQRADLVTVDGMPVVWATHWHGLPVPERVTGADLVPRLATRCADRGFRLYLMGAAPGIADRAADRLRAVNPSLVVRASTCSELRTMDDMDRDVLDDIAAWRPDVVLVALGHPKQEWWIDRFGEELGAGVYIGVGGTLDFLAGSSKRAPLWMQRAGLEWAHRVVRAPRRLARRYAIDAIRVRRLLHRHDAVELRPIHGSETTVDVENGGMVLRPVDRVPEPPPIDGVNCVVVDLSALQRLDGRSVGNLVALATAGRAQGVPVQLRGMTTDMVEVLADAKVLDLLTSSPTAAVRSPGPPSEDAGP